MSISTHVSKNCFLKLILMVGLFFSIVGQSPTATTYVKPGHVMGPHNRQRVQGMVGEHLLNRIKGGYIFKIDASTLLRDPKHCGYRDSEIDTTPKDSRYCYPPKVLFIDAAPCQNL